MCRLKSGVVSPISFSHFLGDDISLSYFLLIILLFCLETVTQSYISSQIGSVPVYIVP